MPHLAFNLTNLCFFVLFFFLPGKMSDIRSERKRQQLNNLVAMVTELARPGNTIVDFCSGTVGYVHQSVFQLTAA